MRYTKIQKDLISYINETNGHGLVFYDYLDRFLLAEKYGISFAVGPKDFQLLLWHEGRKVEESDLQKVYDFIFKIERVRTDLLSQNLIHCFELKKLQYDKIIHPIWTLERFPSVPNLITNSKSFGVDFKNQKYIRWCDEKVVDLLRHFSTDSLVVFPGLKKYIQHYYLTTEELISMRNYIIGWVGIGVAFLIGIIGIFI